MREAVHEKPVLICPPVRQPLPLQSAFCKHRITPPIQKFFKHLCTVNSDEQKRNLCLRFPSSHLPDRTHLEERPDLDQRFDLLGFIDCWVEMVAVAERASDDCNLMHHSAAAADRDHSDFRRDVKKLVENLLSKLNPLAEEFFPSSQSPTAASSYDQPPNSALSADAPAYVAASENGVKQKEYYADGLTTFGYRKKRRNGYGPVKRTSEKVQNAQREDRIRRTVYISDIDQHVTKEQLAALFATCGHVLDCRVCGDPHSVLRFAFIEFADEQGAIAALSLGGTVLGYYPLRVLPSKTAILPVNPTYLPHARSEDEKEMCARTIYCTNIDKKVTRAEVKALFEAICGKVSRLRLLGDRAHSTRIAFVEFVAKPSYS